MGGASLTMRLHLTRRPCPSFPHGSTLSAGRTKARPRRRPQLIGYQLIADEMAPHSPPHGEGPPGKRASAETEDSFSQKSIFAKVTSVAGNRSLSLRLVLGSEVRVPGPPGKRASAETEDSFSQKSIFAKGTSVAGNESRSFKLALGSEVRVPGPPGRLASAGLRAAFSQKIFVMRKSVAGNESLSYERIFGKRDTNPRPARQALQEENAT